MAYKRFLIAAAVLLVGMALVNVMIDTQPSPSHVKAARDGSVTSQPVFPEPCTVADFTVSKLRAGIEYDSAKLTGIVTSRCGRAAGVRLKWTAFNSDGSIAFSSDFWPASTTNIPPHSDYPFEMMESAPRGKWTFTVEPVAVDMW